MATMATMATLPTLRALAAAALASALASTGATETTLKALPKEQRDLIVDQVHAAVPIAADIHLVLKVRESMANNTKQKDKKRKRGAKDEAGKPSPTYLCAKTYATGGFEYQTLRAVIATVLGARCKRSEPWNETYHLPDGTLTVAVATKSVLVPKDQPDRGVWCEWHAPPGLQAAARAVWLKELDANLLKQYGAWHHGRECQYLHWQCWPVKLYRALEVAIPDALREIEWDDACGLADVLETRTKEVLLQTRHALPAVFRQDDGLALYRRISKTETKLMDTGLVGVARRRMVQKLHNMEVQYATDLEIYCQEHERGIARGEAACAAVDWRGLVAIAAFRIGRNYRY